MSQNFRTLIVGAVVITLGFVVLDRSTGQIPNVLKVDRWDYLIQSGNEVSLTSAKTNGNDGWELVTVYQQNEGDFRAIYKRSLR